MTKTRVVGILAVVLALAFAGVAYAAIQSKVTGGAGATAGYFDLVVIGTTQASSVAAVVCHSGDTGDTFDFTADILLPGESCTFTATIQNDGNVKALLTLTEDKTSLGTSFEYLGSLSALEVAAGGTVVYTAVLSMKDTATAPATGYVDVTIEGAYP